MLWPTVYTDLPVGEPWTEYARMVRAAGTVGGWGVLSHQSAAVLWGLPMLDPDFSRVHSTIDHRHRGGFVSAKRHVHPRPLPPQDVVVLEGLRLTSTARTAVDTALAGNYEQALAVFDGARRASRFPTQASRPSVPLADLIRVIEELGPRTGRETALRALRDSVQSSESVGESWSRARMIEWKLRMPELQRRFVVADRVYYADFRWGPLVGEFDGDGKYERDADRRRYEKRRDSDFATLGMVVCHWSWADLRSRERFYQVLTTALFRAGVMRSIPRFPG